MRLTEKNISIILGALVIIVVGILVFNYFKKIPQEKLLEKLPEVKESIIKIERTPIDDNIDIYEGEGVVCYVYRNYGISCLSKSTL